MISVKTQDVTVQEDLPPPESADSLEKLKVPGEFTEDLRFARDRTGWAPRFEIVKTEEEENEGTLLDHQTFLESKLDDKFFGGV